MSVVEIDKGLFTQIKKGDEKALELLFRKYYPTLCLYAQTYVHSPEISEDIVTDRFTDIWLKRNQIDISYNVKSYLYTTIKNAALEYIRKKKIDTISFDDYFVNPPDDSDDPFNRMSNKQTQEQILILLQEIPPRSRQVFIMHRFDEMKYKDIASLLEISSKTVENHMSIAIKILNQNKLRIAKLLELFSIILFALFNS